MGTNFPTSLDALTNPTGSSALTSPDHATQHADANDAIEALQSKVGVNGSAVTSSLDYKVTNGIMSALNVDSGTLYVDATNNRVGVNNTTPSYPLDVTGTTQSTQFLQGTDYLSPYQGFRNKIINGDFSIWQRGTGTSFSSMPYIGTADRWYHSSNVSFGYAFVNREILAPGAIPGYDAQYFLGSINYFYQPNVFSQRIEDVRTLAGRTVTLSFWVNNFGYGTTFISSSLTQNFGSGGSTAVQTNFSNVVTTNGWSRVSGTLTLPSISGKTVGANSYLQLTLNTSTHYFVGIAGVQLEQGSVATPFEQRPLGVELALCQRYYFVSGVVFSGFIANNANQFGEGFSFQFPVTMRATPTLSNSFTSNDNAVLQASSVTDKSVYIRETCSNTGFPYSSFTYSFIVSAEL